MFLDNSRYFNVQTVEAEDERGSTVQAVKLRRLPFVNGTPTEVGGVDRLDVMAQRNYSDGTKFWHVADANTELEANNLVKEREQDKETRVINVPDK
jgi:hypothetical protein